MNIVDDKRPKTIKRTPPEYNLKRPKINILLDKIKKMWINSYNNAESNTLKINTESNNYSPQNSRLYYSNFNSTNYNLKYL